MSTALNLSPSPQRTLVLDTGATGNFASPNDIKDDLNNATSRVRVKMPNGAVITSTHTGQLPIQALTDLPAPAATTHVIPKLQHTLISVGKLCDYGCRAIFDKQHAYIKYGEKTLIKGSQTPNGLWTILPSFKKYNEQAN